MLRFLLSEQFKKSQTWYCCGKNCVRHGSVLQLPRPDATGRVAAWQPQTATSNFPVSFTSNSIQYILFLPLTIQKLWFLWLLHTSQKTVIAVNRSILHHGDYNCVHVELRTRQKFLDSPGTISGQSQLSVCCCQQLPSANGGLVFPRSNSLSGRRKTNPFLPLSGLGAVSVYARKEHLCTQVSGSAEVSKDKALQ